MLTETEKKWLEERKQYIQQYSSETFCCFKGATCRECRLKHARLAVEEEMDKEAKE